MSNSLKAVQVARGMSHSLCVVLLLLTCCALAAQTAAGWETYLSRLEPHLAGGYLSEEVAHAPWEEFHERYAERFGVDPTPGRRFLAAQRAGQ